MKYKVSEDDVIEGFSAGDMADVKVMYKCIDNHSAIVYFPPKEDYECGSLCVAALHEDGYYVNSEVNWINHTLKDTE